MMRKHFPWALGLVLATNTLVLAGVAYNRSGTPSARLVLSARELPMAWGMGDYGDGAENTGVSLRLEWEQGTPAVLTRGKLEALGFRLPPAQQHAKAYKHLLDRKAYAVFEYRGAAWAALLQEKQANLAQALEQAKTDKDRQRLRDAYDQFEKTASRLVLVDAGLDPAALHARYADGGRYLIAKARVSVYPAYRGSADDQAQSPVQSHIAVLPDTIYVAREFSRLIESPEQAARRRASRYNPEQRELPDYQVTLAYGRRQEPWVEGVARVSPARE